MCLDCGLDYANFLIDVVLPRDQWLLIHPDEHGLLCAGCIVKRAAKIPGVICCHMAIMDTPQTTGHPMTLRAKAEQIARAELCADTDFTLCNEEGPLCPRCELLANVIESALSAAYAEGRQARKGCINCGIADDGGYGTEEIGTFCSQCWDYVLAVGRAEGQQEARGRCAHVTEEALKRWADMPDDAFDWCDYDMEIEAAKQAFRHAQTMLAVLIAELPPPPMTDARGEQP